MPRFASILVLLAAACGSSNKDDPFSGESPDKLLDTRVTGAELAYYKDGFAIEVEDGWQQNKTLPDGIKRRFQQGQTWILLLEPIVFSDASRWIAHGATPFLPNKIELQAAHDRRDDDTGEAPPLRPAMLVLKGVLPIEEARKRLFIERLDKDLDISEIGLSHGLKAVDSSVDRVALGRGIETAMRIATGRLGTEAGSSSYDWMVTHKDGQQVDDPEWIAAIDKTAAERRPYRAIVRRYQPGAKKRVSWYSIPLNVVLVCSQMKVEPAGSGIAWQWEGFWLGRLGKPEISPESVGTPTVAVRYAEFRTKKGQRRGGEFLSSFFNPITRTGRTALDEVRRRGEDAFIPTAD
ncbi:MAG: hypothetical protein AAGD14_04185 [Planctomycetota bacterium]